jgi:phosphoadenosine phosphosulfate reductase
VSADLFGYESDRDKVGGMNEDDRVARAIALLKRHEPAEGYYLAFSGGKDSCVIKELARMAGVLFEAVYNNTTIDPPELVRFIKEHHADVKWNQPEHGNMMHRVAVRTGAPPTRMARWCCEEYKEGGAIGRVCIFGVRASESKARAMRWHEFADYKAGSNQKTVVCPIVYWSDAQVWEFLKGRGIPYCSIYDEGWDRLGCVGCPLASVERQSKEFARWPKYEANWKRAIIANWEKWKDVPNSRTGEPRYHAKFKTGEDFWQWWRTTRVPDYLREECQSGLLWTNQEGEGEL